MNLLRWWTDRRAVKRRLAAIRERYVVEASGGSGASSPAAVLQSEPPLVSRTAKRGAVPSGTGSVGGNAA